jgi:nucleotide-binding universal stress UspA family protein
MLTHNESASIAKAPRPALINVKEQQKARPGRLDRLYLTLDARQGGKRAQAVQSWSASKVAETIMFEHILIATDGSELADKAVEQSIMLAKALGAKVTVVMVTESWDALSRAALAQAQVRSAVADYENHMAAAANRILWSAGEKAKKLDVAYDTIHLKDRHPAEGIIETAQAEACDLIVIASHGRRAIMTPIIGSQANRVATLSPVPVLVCP